MTAPGTQWGEGTTCRAKLELGLSLSLSEMRAPSKRNELMLHPFANGGSALVGKAVLEQLKLKGITSLGMRDEGLFISPTHEIDRLLAKTHNPRKIESALGLPPGHLGDDFIRVDIPDALERNLRLPDPRFREKDPYHIPNSGMTIGGIPEAVIDPIPMYQFGL